MYENCSISPSIRKMKTNHKRSLYIITQKRELRCPVFAVLFTITKIWIPSRHRSINKATASCIQVISFSCKHEWNFVIWSNMDRTKEQYAKWRRRQLLHVPFNIQKPTWFLNSYYSRERRVRVSGLMSINHSSVEGMSSWCYTA